MKTLFLIFTLIIGILVLLGSYKIYNVIQIIFVLGIKAMAIIVIVLSIYYLFNI